jgi:hypothetical protein
MVDDAVIALLQSLPWGCAGTANALDTDIDWGDDGGGIDENDGGGIDEDDGGGIDEDDGGGIDEDDGGNIDEDDGGGIDDGVNALLPVAPDTGRSSSNWESHRKPLLRKGFKECRSCEIQAICSYPYL